jgi:hypothetical protein
VRDREKVFGQEEQEAAQGENADADAGRSAYEGEQEIFDPELPLDLLARGSQGQARGYFGGAAHHAYQSQTGEVGAGDEKDESRGQHQRQSLRAQRSGLTFLERH